jgi:hypothetical protein
MRIVDAVSVSRVGGSLRPAAALARREPGLADRTTLPGAEPLRPASRATGARTATHLPRLDIGAADTVIVPHGDRRFGAPGGWQAQPRFSGHIPPLTVIVENHR